MVLVVTVVEAVVTVVTVVTVVVDMLVVDVVVAVGGGTNAAGGVDDATVTAAGGGFTGLPLTLTTAIESAPGTYVPASITEVPTSGFSAAATFASAEFFTKMTASY